MGGQRRRLLVLLALVAVAAAGVALLWPRNHDAEQAAGVLERSVPALRRHDDAASGGKAGRISSAYEPGAGLEGTGPTYRFTFVRENGSLRIRHYLDVF